PKAVSHGSFGHLVAGKIGKAMWKIEPRGWAGAAVSSPECRSMIIRQSASPNPIPWDFVVTNASKMFFACFGSIPRPESSIDRMILSSPWHLQHPMIVFVGLHRFNCVADEINEDLL